MGDGTPICSRLRWVLVLCTLAAICGMTAHVAADAAAGFPGVWPVGQCTPESDAADTQPAAYDLLSDAAFPSTVTIVMLEPVLFLPGMFSLARLKWIFPPLVRPPIVFVRTPAWSSAWQPA
jgi:hypothetical protein